MAAEEIFQTTAIEIIYLIVIETTTIIDHKTALTTDRIITNTSVNLVIFLERETTTIKTD